MKKSVKAALMSALIVPGAGHLYLRRHLMGGVLVGATLIALYILVSSALEKAQAITDKILSGEVQPDILAIAELVRNQSQGGDAPLVEFAIPAVIIAWLIGIIDSFRVGRLQENTHPAAPTS
jgi:hypothetical protein